MDRQELQNSLAHIAKCGGTVGELQALIDPKQLQTNKHDIYLLENKSNIKLLIRSKLGTKQTDVKDLATVVLIQTLTPLIISKVRKYPAEHLDDLESVCMLAVIKSIQMYDETRGNYIDILKLCIADDISQYMAMMQGVCRIPKRRLRDTKSGKTQVYKSFKDLKGLLNYDTYVEVE